MPDFISEDQIERALGQKLQHLPRLDSLDCPTEDPEDLNEGSNRAWSPATAWVSSPQLMHWIEPSEKDTATASLEKRLWDSANRFRANSGQVKCRIAKCEFRIAGSSSFETRHSSFANAQSCIVRLLTEVIEPYHGRILDPACGSGGMFVSSARFVAEHKASPPSTRPAGHPSPSGSRDGDEGLAAQYSGDPGRESSIHGVEKTDETGRLARMNLAVHGLEGDIRHAAHPKPWLN